MNFEVPNQPVPEPVKREAFGIPAFIFVIVAGIFASTLASIPWIIAAHGDTQRLNSNTAAVATLAFVQFGVWIVALFGVSAVRGTGNIHRDFGFQIKIKDWPWLLVGVGLQFVALIILTFISIITGFHESQSIVKDVSSSSGLVFFSFLIVVIFIAPMTEETIFRGLLLRRLLRTRSPEFAIWVTAFIFMALHLLDGLGAILAAPAILAVGVLAGARAVKTGSLSQSILIHLGFNLTTGILLAFAK